MDLPGLDVADAVGGATTALLLSPRGFAFAGPAAFFAAGAFLVCGRGGRYGRRGERGMGRAASDSALDATRDATRPRQLSRTRFRFDARDAAGDAPWGPRGRSRPSRRSPTWSDARRGGRRAKRGSVPCAGGSCDGETRARGSARGTFSSPRADFCRVSRHAEIPDQTQGETLNRKHRFADHENVLSDEAEPMEPQNGTAARRPQNAPVAASSGSPLAGRGSSRRTLTRTDARVFTHRRRCRSE